MWKIYDVTGTVNLNNGIYCLKGGRGFGSVNGSETRQTTYTRYADMKSPAAGDDTTLINSYKGILPTTNNYNSIVWILDHAYVPAPSSGATSTQTTNAQKARAKLLSAAGISTNTKLNDHLIDIIQQLAIWYYSNNDQYKATNINNIDLSSTGNSSDWENVADVLNDTNWSLWDGANDTPGDIEKLYTYFINGAASALAPTSNTTNPITLTSNTAITKKENNSYYISGPYTINQIADKNYTLAGELKSSSGATISYTLLNSAKQAASNLTLDNLVGQQFYLRIPSEATVEGAVFTITTTVMQNNITYWTVGGDINSEQPIAIVEPTTTTLNTQTTLSLSEFDLALRKFITKVTSATGTNKTITSREPQIATTGEYAKSKLNNGKTTVGKTHKKTPPVEVEPGDTVLYTIRIYNEGTLDGYASEIKDYLPEGLQFISTTQSSINQSNGWSATTQNGKTIVTTTKLSKANGTSNLLKAFDGTNISTKDLQIECKVTAAYMQTEQTLKNVAEITACTDENENPITDRDSPNILTDTQKNTYNPGTSEQGWGYEDDDDYEPLVIPGKYFDLALRKYITQIVDKNGTPKQFDSRVPQVSTQKFTDQPTTFRKDHTKSSLTVETGDIITYRIAIYNEGELDGYATKITDYLPEGLEYIPEGSTWQMYDSAKNVTTDATKARILETTSLSNTKIVKYNGTSLASAYVEVKCKVVATTSNKTQQLKNIAEITEHADENKNLITDKDSTPKNLSDEQKNTYNPPTAPQGMGYEDDDDYEIVELPGKYFDLALRKFVTKVVDNNGNETEPDRIPKTTPQDLTKFNSTDDETTITKSHTKTAVPVDIGYKVTYRIQVYNEGTLDGKATEITDYLPEGLEFIPASESTVNAQNNWEMYDKDGKSTEIASDARIIKTKKLANTLLEKYNASTYGQNDDKNNAYVEVECIVKVTPSTESQTLRNIAAITKHENELVNTDTGKDRDSEPETIPNKDNYDPKNPEKGIGEQDDDDYEDLVIPAKEFDLSLRKYITELRDKNGKTKTISNTRVLDNINTETISTTKTAEYKHRKDPVRVSVGDTVIYTIRVYNEGEIGGYASEVTDYLPPQLEFVMNDDENFNAQYGWKIDSSMRKATTQYLARPTIDPEEKLIKAFDGTKLDYKELKIKCKVVSTNNLDKVITNIAEITGFTDANGKTVTDRDSGVTGDRKVNLPTDADLPDYKGKEGNEGNKSILTDPEYFYKGQEDDDDFEKIIIEEFDLALRKFITKVNDTEITTRIPKFTKIKDENGNYIYEHTKDPVEVQNTDIVEYTLRIYNEGQIPGYAKEVKDNIPEGLEFLPQNTTNQEYRWIMIDKDGNKTEDTSKAVAITTDYLSKEQEMETGRENQIAKFVSSAESPAHKDVKVAFKVIAPNSYKEIITNIAQISDDSDENGNPVDDKDSTPNNDEPKEDDQDEEHIKLKYFDLALRKFITKVNDTEITTRKPNFTKIKDENGNYIYEHTKDPVEVQTTDKVEYTLRIYNEGQIAGYAKEVKDNIPEGLEFLPANNTNKEYRWIMIDKEGNETDEPEKAVAITTDYLSKEQENEEEKNNLIAAFDDTKESPDYKDVKVVFKVVSLNSYKGIITNIAQISDDSDDNGNPVDDKDSKPDNDEPKEDDQDEEHIKLKYFDLALRKFITAVNNTQITTRVPKFKIDENGKYVYEHTKEPVEVENGNIITYTIRAYNEGTIAGYAEEIKDDLPEGLEYIPENETNKIYGWVMLDKEGKATEDIAKAVSIKTNYLSKKQGEEGANAKVIDEETGLQINPNLLHSFNEGTMQEPEYREVKIAFKVTEPNTSDRILINKAQISDDSDEKGNPVTDVDSTPDKWIETDDDQDTEKVKVKYFDLSLRKWVTQAIVIDNGKQTVTETGHKAEDNPEAPVKVEIKQSNINKVVVKFRYKIRVKNEGEIPGYATEISDYIPEGLKFVAADNPNWKEENGKITTESLKDTLLKPGETAEVEVLLTWINGKDNFGLKTNTAEISKDKNDSNTPDIDSIPNNKVTREDDIDDAPVLLSVKTGNGENMQYVFLATGTFAILGAGVILIKKFVL